MRAFRSAFRVFLLLLLVLFAIQFVGACPAPGNGSKATLDAQQEPHRPAARQAAPAPQQPEVTPGELAAAQENQNNSDLHKQLSDVERQFEQDAINRMLYGRAQSYDAFDRFLNQFIPFLVFIGVTLALMWLLRTLLENRRWNKMVKVQTDTHAKLLDRFASSQEMLAYMQSDAGKKFLEAPVFEGQRRQVSALPFSRILWSVQIGIIAAIFGIGILFLRGRVSPDADMGVQVFGTLILTLGIGFLVSGGVSYFLAKHFGLLEQRDALARSEHNA